MLAMSLLGGLRLSINDRPFRFEARPKVRPLLAYVVLNCRRPVTRDAAAFALWPDEREASARGNLRRHLLYLRNALPPSRIPWVIADQRTVCWNPATRLRLDVEIFERFAAEPAKRRQAVELYAELLPECEDEWLIGPRDRLRETYISALWELARELRGRRDPAAAQTYLERMLSLDPWREDVVRALMAVRCEAGDRASALAACAQFEERLTRDMNSALMPETAALRQAIERNEPLATVPSSQAGGETAAPPDLPFRGRDEEMSWLMRAWDRCGTGRAAAASIFGEAGIGKTRLATEFALRVETRGARVLWGATSTPESRPYEAMANVVASALAFVDPDVLSDVDRRLLSRMVPGLARDADANDPVDALGQERLAFAVAGILRRTAAERPLLIVLENAHEAGHASQALRERVVAACSQSALMVLLTSRERGAKQESLRALGRLSLQSATEIAVAALGRRAAAGAARRVAERSDGHPLFLAAMLFATPDGFDAPDSRLPPQLHAAIEKRIAQVTPEARLLLKAASVSGRTFDLDVVAEIVGWNQAEFNQAADELIGRRLIRESPRAADYEFSHDLVASAAYETLAINERTRWHRRTARVMQRRYASRAGEMAASIARHFDAAGELESAAAQYAAAARAAFESFANDEALAYARRGIALQPASASLKFDLLATQDDALERLGDRAAQRALTADLERFARESGDPERVRESLRRRESLHRYLGNYECAFAAIEQLRTLSVGNARWEAVALRDQAQAQVACTSIREAHDTIAKAVPFAEAAHDAGVLISTLLMQVHLAARRGYRAEAEAAILRAHEVARESASPALLMRAAYCEAVAVTLFQDWARAARVSRELIKRAERVGSLEVLANAHTMLGGACINLFRIEDARRHLRKAVALYRERDVEATIASYNNLADAELEIGRVDSAETALHALEAEARRGKSWSGYGYALLIRCQAALVRENYAVTLALADDAISGAVEHSDRLIEGEANRCKGTAQLCGGETATETLERAHQILSEIGATDGAQRAAAQLSLAYARAGAGARAFDLARTVLSADVASPAVLWPVARALHDLADDAMAAQALRRAFETFDLRRESLRSEGDRKAYALLPWHRELVATHASGVWPGERHSSAPA